MTNVQHTAKPQLPRASASIAGDPRSAATEARSERDRDVAERMGLLAVASPRTVETAVGPSAPTPARPLASLGSWCSKLVAGKVPSADAGHSFGQHSKPWQLQQISKAAGLAAAKEDAVRRLMQSWDAATCDQVAAHAGAARGLNDQECRLDLLHILAESADSATLDARVKIASALAGRYSDKIVCFIVAQCPSANIQLSAVEPLLQHAKALGEKVAARDENKLIDALLLYYIQQTHPAVRMLVGKLSLAMAIEAERTGFAEVNGIDDCVADYFDKSLGEIIYEMQFRGPYAAGANFRFKITCNDPDPTLNFEVEIIDDDLESLAQYLEGMVPALAGNSTENPSNT